MILIIYILCTFINILICKSFIRIHSPHSTFYVVRKIRNLVDNSAEPNLSSSPGQGEWPEWNNNAHNGDADDIVNEVIVESSMPPSKGTGEWEDWDNNAHNIDPDFDDNETLGPVINTQLLDESTVITKQSLSESTNEISVSSDISKPVGRGEWADWSGDDSFDGEIYDEDNPIQEKIIESPNATWEWWNEDAPYFDENDYIDEDGNVGRKENIAQEVSWSVGSSFNNKGSWDVNTTYATVHLSAQASDSECALVPVLSSLLHSIGRPWALSYSSPDDTISPTNVLVDEMKLPLSMSTLRYIALSVSKFYLNEWSAQDKLRVDLALELALVTRLHEREAESVCTTAESWISGRSFLVGQELSVGDLALFHTIRNVQSQSPHILSEKSELLAYMSRVSSMLPSRAKC